MPSGATTIDFGAFPGTSHATVHVAGQAAILSTSLVEAWLLPKDTADHTADEHIVETIKIIAGPPSAGVGFTVHGVNTSEITEPAEPFGLRGRFSGTGAAPGRGQQGIGEGADASGGGRGTRLYGQWSVGWVWV